MIRILLVTALLLVSPHLIVAQASPPKGITFEVVSVRAMEEKEALSRTGTDVIGANVTARLRLSCMGRGIMVYGEEFTIVPSVLMIKQTGKELMWFYGGGQKNSPGLSAHGASGKWLIVPRYSVIEWEELDSTAYQGNSHAFTIFTQDLKTKEIVEIVSDFFTVPGTKARQAGKGRNKCLTPSNSH